MPFRWWIKSIRFSDGEEVNLDPASMLVLIGPNQGGKSTALQNLQELLPNAPSARTVVAAVDVGKEGTADDLLDWFRRHHHSRTTGSEEQFLTRAGLLGSDSLRSWWDSNFWNVIAAIKTIAEDPKPFDDVTKFMEDICRWFGVTIQ